MIYRFADFITKIDNASLYAINLYSNYCVNTEKIDKEIVVSMDDINSEINNTGTREIKSIVFDTCVHRKLAEWLPLHNAFVLHSVAFDVNGVGVAFAAHSGTGKTTHTMLWQQLLGDKMTIVNGDKPIVRFFDNLENAPEGTEIGVPYAYGTPWNGKEHLGCNMRTPLKHICFIERSETNYVEKISANDAIDRIFNQVYMPQNPEAMMNTMQLINRLINSCELWIIHCNMDISAAQTAYNEIFK